MFACATCKNTNKPSVTILFALVQDLLSLFRLLSGSWFACTTSSMSNKATSWIWNRQLLPRRCIWNTLHSRWDFSELVLVRRQIVSLTSSSLFLDCSFHLSPLHFKKVKYIFIPWLHLASSVRQILLKKRQAWTVQCTSWRSCSLPTIMTQRQRIEKNCWNNCQCSCAKRRWSTSNENILCNNGKMDQSLRWPSWPFRCIESRCIETWLYEIRCSRIYTVTVSSSSITARTNLFNDTSMVWMVTLQGIILHFYCDT